MKRKIMQFIGFMLFVIGLSIVPIWVKGIIFIIVGAFGMYVWRTP